MDEMSEAERAAFIEIYGCADDDVQISPRNIESLIQRGLLSRASDGSYNPTTLGDELYQQMEDDEPYEGV
jgi:hypothetical protein